jgi:hypothetical protein
MQFPSECAKTASKSNADITEIGMDLLKRKVSNQRNSIKQKRQPRKGD